MSTRDELRPRLIPTRISEQNKRKFWAKIKIRAQHECWLYDTTAQGGWTKNGKRFKARPPKFTFREGKGENVMWFAIQPHRLAWYFAYGGRDPYTLDIEHTCKNGLCCNPRHLQAKIPKA